MKHKYAEVGNSELQACNIRGKGTVLTKILLEFLRFWNSFSNFFLFILSILGDEVNPIKRS